MLAIRERNSRLVKSADEIVYYSVADFDELKSQPCLQKIVHDLIDWGISSEQDPQSLQGAVDNPIEGNWNIQCTAAKTHLIDFSHFFVLPHSKLPQPWKMSEAAASDALKAGWKYNSLFKSEALMEKMLGTSNKEEALKKFTQGELPGLELKFKDMGKVGLVKPSYSWSWFLEADDGAISKMSFAGEFDWFKAIHFVDSNLPSKN